MSSISIIICTYNPDPGIFEKCLSALDKACELFSPTEILVIDNNSETPVSEYNSYKQISSKYSFVKLINEKEQGLTPARLRGIKEAKGSLLIFVDDDNFISPNFIKEAQKVSDNYPFIGAFSGQVRLLPEKTPAEWTKKYWGMLVHRVFSGNHWSNLAFNNDTMPCGAGLCIKKEVADHYYNLHTQGKRSIQLDRSKNSLLSGGDNDLAMCALDIGMGMGLFDSLSVEHFIPAGRFTKEYLTKLAYGIYYSYVVLKYYRTGIIEEQSKKRKILNKARYISMSSEDRAINESLNRGLADAAIFLHNLNNHTANA